MSFSFASSSDMDPNSLRAQLDLARQLERYLAQPVSEYKNFLILLKRERIEKMKMRLAMNPELSPIEHQACIENINQQARSIEEPDAPCEIQISSGASGSSSGASASDDSTIACNGNDSTIAHASDDSVAALITGISGLSINNHHIALTALEVLPATPIEELPEPSSYIENGSASVRVGKDYTNTKC
jgi:hypothetical protein